MLPFPPSTFRPGLPFFTDFVAEYLYARAAEIDAIIGILAMRQPEIDPWEEAASLPRHLPETASTIFIRESAACNPPTRCRQKILPAIYRELLCMTSPRLLPR